ncbi:MAG: DUF4339 domain-containing protein [Planctomycetota bacterium]|nr:DUF4339 domain-containing protein [Planctomycetota bacterium]
MSERAWFYSRGGRQLGPVNSAELKRLAGVAQLSPVDLVWCEGMENWAPASEVKGLFSPAVNPGISGIGQMVHAAPANSGNQAANGGSQAVAGEPSTISRNATAAAVVANATAHAAKAAEVAREASREAAGTFQLLMTDPIGKIGTAYEQLGPRRALLVGLAFIVGFVIAIYLSALIGSSPVGIDVVSADSFGIFLKSLLLVVLSLATLVGVVSLFRLTMKSTATVAADLFTVGAALVPLGVVSLVTSVLDKSKNVGMTISMVLTIFAAVFSVLIAHSSLVANVRLSARTAGLAWASAISGAILVAGFVVWLYIRLSFS